MSISSIILLVLVFALILIVVYLRSRPRSVNDNGIIYDYRRNIRHKLKTGDIILFSSKENGSVFDKIKYWSRTKLLGTEYGHVGLILKNPKTGELFLLECTDYMHTADDEAIHLNNYNRGSVRIINLDTLIDKYYQQQMGIFSVKFIEKEIPYNLIMNKLREYKDVIFEDKWKLVFLATTDLLISHDFAKKLTSSPNSSTDIIKHFRSNNRYRKMMCAEFVHEILYRCGALKAYPSKLFWPHIYTSAFFKELEIIKFTKQYKFTVKK